MKRNSAGLLFTVLLLLLLSACGTKQTAAPQPIPLRTYTHSYSEEDATPPRACSIRYPGVDATNDAPALVSLDDYLTSTGERLWGSCQAESQDESDTGAINAEWDYQVMRNDGTYLSVLYSGVVNYGGAYPITNVYAQTFRLNEKEAMLVELNDLFTVSATEYLPLLQEKLTKLAAGDYPNDVFAQLEDVQFYLKDNALVIFYPEDSIAPHAAGIPTFEIPFSDLSGKLVPELVKGAA